MTESDSIAAATTGGTAAARSSASAGPPAFKDRKVGLVIFGIIQLLMALGFLAMAGLQLLVVTGAMGPEFTGPPGLYAVAAAVYVVIAAGTAWLGIGSILCRRWARAMTLVLAWMGLAVGLLSTGLLVSAFRGLATEMARAAEAAGTADAQAGVTFALGCAFLCVAFFYIVLPAAFVRWAWLGALLLVTLNGVSAYLTFRGDGLLEIYAALGTPPEQIEIMESIGILTTLPWMMLASVLVMLGFYLWLGRYFAAAQSYAAS